MQFTLGNLLDERELGLELVTSDAAARRRVVHGAHAIEIPRPAPWVPERWIMLTNGMAFRGRAADQRRLIAELAEGGQAALGWSVGLVLQRIPRGILDEAERRAFPVFRIPFETPHHAIISLVHNARSGSDTAVIRQVSSMEDYLMDALGADAPEQAIVARLAHLLAGDVVLLDSDGSVAAASGREPSDAVLAAVLAQDSERLAETTGRCSEILRFGPDGASRTLAVSTARRPQDGVVLPVMRRAERLLEYLAQERMVRLSTAQRHGSRLLAQALHGVPESHVTALDAEVETFGIDLAEGAEVVAFDRPADIGSSTAAAALVSELLEASAVPHLATAFDGWPIALIPASAPLSLAVEDDAGCRARTVPRAGVGRTVHSLSQARDALRDAHLALSQARARGAGTTAGVVRYGELDPVGQVLAAAGDEERLTQISGLLDPLRGQPHLLRTLRCWFDCGCNPAKAAARLHLHRNSIRYRISRIEELLGQSLDDPRGNANILLALLSESLAPGESAPGDGERGGDARRGRIPSPSGRATCRR